VERTPPDNRPAYDPKCYLCPGNERAGGFQNPGYSSTFVFENDFAALLPDGPQGPVELNDLFTIQAETGICRVVCFSPRHDLTIPEMAVADIRAVVDLWAAQVEELGARPEINYVQLFENKGAVMGCSNPHPHGQIWANYSIPLEPAKEDARQRDYLANHENPLLVDYLAGELDRNERIVVQNEEWVALVPFWAVWPYETMLLPRRHVMAARPLLPAVAPLGHRQEIHGGLRNVGHAPTRHHRRTGGQPPARAERSALQIAGIGIQNPSPLLRVPDSPEVARGAAEDAEDAEKYGAFSDHAAQAGNSSPI
jgi:galactose-1-phosphate uridylyltransferase (family 1)